MVEMVDREECEWLKWLTGSSVRWYWSVSACNRYSSAKECLCCTCRTSFAEFGIRFLERGESLRSEDQYMYIIYSMLGARASVLLWVWMGELDA